MAEIYDIKNHPSSLALLWNQALGQVDAWSKRAEFNEEVLLQSANQFAENVKRNQSNIKELTEQFSKELQNWEKTAREELLTTTAGMQYLFPVKSYEEINTQLDDVQNKTANLTLSPLGHLLKGEQVDKFVSALGQYIEFRRNNRNLYVKNVKETASIIQDNQRAFFKIMADQVKNVFFPFQKYMDNREEITKS